MLLNYLFIFTVIGAVAPANIQGRNIPVEVRYHDTTTNLAEKPQLSDNELIESNTRLEKLKQESLIDSLGSEKENLKNNFDENIQQSQDESSKYISGLQENTSGESGSNKLTWLQQVQQHFEKGLQDIRKNFKPNDPNEAPNEEVWNKLEEEVRDYFAGEKNKLSLKQDQGGSQQNFFQNLANGFQQITNNFVQSFQGQNAAQNGTQGDDGAQPIQGGWQGFVGYFQGGVQNLVSTVQNIGGGGQPANSTVLGDNGSAPPSNFFGDSGSTPQPSQGFFAGAVSQFNQVVGNIIPTQPPQIGTQSDEASSSTPQGPIQQVFQSFGNIGTAFNQFIQGGPQQNPSGSEDEASTPQSPNFIQSIGQNIGNAIQNFQQQFVPGQSSQSSGGVANPIIEQASNVGSQFQQLTPTGNPIGSLLPATPSEPSPSRQSEEQGPEKPATNLDSKDSESGVEEKAKGGTVE
ncbi:uncharacterized protein LOC132697304 isoform X2 [Cylas formicarius]|uniref:uncharacterized protein LOC132697304 isoform X2 n=1 Tax=Cylas formicarius TaxID=197179 RepID=UPI002958525F|nr:uncharacterized protein LOC132697304 isoform X2 [Cylas formicarius]